MKATTSRSIAPSPSSKRAFSRAVIAPSSPPAWISRTTAVAVGLSVNTFSERVSNSTAPNFSSRNLTYFANCTVVAPPGRHAPAKSEFDISIDRRLERHERRSGIDATSFPSGAGHLAAHKRDLRGERQRFRADIVAGKQRHTTENAIVVADELIVVIIAARVTRIEPEPGDLVQADRADE